MSSYDPAEQSFYNIVLESFQELEDNPEWDATDGLDDYSVVDAFEDDRHDEVRRFGYQFENGNYLALEINPNKEYVEGRVVTPDNHEIDSARIEQSQNTLNAEQNLNELIDSAEEYEDHFLAP